MNNQNINQTIYPNTFYDREDKQNNNYFFISYSHRDQELVFNILNQLYRLGVNYWYDKELDPGDIWNKRVESVIYNSHCRGAIIFMSENSLISNAVEREMKIMENILNERSFRIVPVIIGYESAKNLILDVALDYDSFYQDGKMNLFQKYTNDGIWIKSDNAVEEINALAESDNLKYSTTINLRKSFLEEINYTSHSGTRSFLCGKYPKEEDGELQDIEWVLIKNEGKYYYFVSKYCLDFLNYKNIEFIIDKIKRTVNSKKYIEDITLINEEFINDNINIISESLPTNYADRNRQQLLRLFWVSENNGKEKNAYSLYNSKNIKIKEKIQKNKINAGIRLILIINNDKIGE